MTAAFAIGGSRQGLSARPRPPAFYPMLGYPNPHDCRPLRLSAVRCDKGTGNVRDRVVAADPTLSAPSRVKTAPEALQAFPTTG